MQDPIDARIAAENVALRAIERQNAPRARPPVPDRALIGERLADHGKDSGRKARTEMADALADMARQIAILHRNPTMNAAQILLAAEPMVRHRIDRLLDQVEAERAIVANRRADIAAGVAAALRTPRSEWQAAAPEIRAVLREMNADEQDLFLDSLKGDDALMVQYAVAGVHPALSRVSFGVHKSMRDDLIQRHEPELLTKPADIDAREAALAVVEDGIRRTAADLVDFDQAAALKALVSGDDA